MGMVLLALYLHSRLVASDKPETIIEYRLVASDKPETIIEYSTKIDIYIYYIDNDSQK
jgi:hypothetical protein